jgi:hypothetical protein
MGYEGQSRQPLAVKAWNYRSPGGFNRTSGAEGTGILG